MPFEAAERSTGSREGGREGEREREGERGRGGGREREREKASVHSIVCALSRNSGLYSFNRLCTEFTHKHTCAVSPLSITQNSSSVLCVTVCSNYQQSKHNIVKF